jgi:hypothetical protein
MQDKLFRQAALEKLSSPEELDQLMQVTTPRGWFALAALIGLVIVAVVIGVVGVIPIRQQAVYCLLIKDGLTDTVSGVLYLPYGNTEQPVKPGDEVHISLADRSGFLLGSVKSASDFPVTDLDMLGVLGNRTLVTQLLNENGSLIEVQVNLIPDTSAPGNYQWSSGQSAGIAIQNRLRCDGNVTIDQKRPIQLILRGS